MEPILIFTSSFRLPPTHKVQLSSWGLQASWNSEPNPTSEISTEENIQLYNLLLPSKSHSWFQLSSWGLKASRSPQLIPLLPSWGSELLLELLSTIFSSCHDLSSAILKLKISWSWSKVYKLLLSVLLGPQSPALIQSSTRSSSQLDPTLGLKISYYPLGVYMFPLPTRPLIRSTIICSHPTSTILLMI